MKKVFIGISVFVILFACKTKGKGGGETNRNTTAITVDSTLITDSTWGLIRANVNFEELKTIYGSAAIKDERICGPECIDSIDVTKIFPDTKNEAIIYWQDSAYHQKIGFITSYSEGADWHTGDGLKIGSSVLDLLRLNGKAIKFYGFGWDYGGAIISYNAGKFEKSPVDFELDKRHDEKDTSMALLGDQEFNTDSPAVKKEIDRIIIREISLSFYKE
jgi:hypothetical protein